MAWSLQAMLINEFGSPDYNFDTCTSRTSSGICTKFEPFGEVTLKTRGLETDYIWVWYGVIATAGIYLILLVVTAVLMNYMRVETNPVPTLKPVNDETEEPDSLPKSIDTGVEIPFEPVNFAFKDVWYTVNLKSGEELDLLKGVSGFFKPGTVTALMVDI